MTIHRCLGENCSQPITWTFAICAKCEKKYGNSTYDWPEWLREKWAWEQRDRRRHKKIMQHEVSFSDLEPQDDIAD